MDGHKKKKPTKAELIASIPKVVDAELHKNYIKNLVQGFELANRMILEYINNGHGLDEVKSFIEKNLSKEGLETMEKVSGGKKDEI